MVYADTDWCGQHKIGTNPDKEAAKEKRNKIPMGIQKEGVGAFPFKDMEAIIPMGTRREEQSIEKKEAGQKRSKCEICPTKNEPDCDCFKCIMEKFDLP